MRKSNSMLAGVVPSTAFHKARFDTMQLHDDWEHLLGKISPNFTMLIHGKPGNGKSTFCYLFAGYLALHHGKVLYITAEEANGYTVKEKLERLKVAHPHLHFADSLESALKKKILEHYDFIFFDSINSAGMTLAHVRGFIKHYPDKALIFVSQNTKSGQARGSLELQHDVDIVLKAEKGTVENVKNRFGGNGKIKVF